jgi:hypothetical protein
MQIDKRKAFYGKVRFLEITKVDNHFSLHQIKPGRVEFWVQMNADNIIFWWAKMALANTQNPKENSAYICSSLLSFPEEFWKRKKY